MVDEPRRAPGAAEGDQPRGTCEAPDGAEGVDMATYNGSGWTSAQAFLHATAAQVATIQERTS